MHQSAATLCPVFHLHWSARPVTPANFADEKLVGDTAQSTADGRPGLFLCSLKVLLGDMLMVTGLRKLPGCRFPPGT